MDFLVLIFSDCLKSDIAIVSVGLIDKEAMETLFIGRQTSEMTNEVHYLRSGNTFVQIVFNCGRITTLETHDFIYYASPIGKADLIKQRMEQNDNI